MQATLVAGSSLSGSPPFSRSESRSESYYGAGSSMHGTQMQAPQCTSKHADPAAADDARVEALREELRTLDLHAAAKAASSWLHSLQQHASSSSSSSSNGTLQANVVSPPQLVAPAVHPPNAAPLTGPPGTDGQPMRLLHPVRMDKMYDMELASPLRSSSALLMKPEPVFHGERDDRQREAAPVYEFPMHVRLS